MDFELSDDQLALRDGAREMLDDFASPARVRAHTATGDAYDTALWRAMTEQGWLGVDLPEDAGGLGLGAVEVAVLLEEVGRHVAPAPFVEGVLATTAYAAAGDNATVARLVGGDAIACVAWGSGPVAYAPSADVAVVIADDAVYGID